MSSARDQAASFGDAERLQLHQLQLLEWQAARDGRGVEEEDPDPESGPVEVPEQWCLTRGVTLYEWQKDCIESWFEGSCRGTVKVVTGAGKTILALAIIERLQNQRAPDLRVAVVVPTIVLMNQWYDELIEHGSLPPSAIGRLGGGYKDDFSAERRVLIAVLASAQKLLPGLVQKAHAGQQLLLITDECHKSGASKMSRIFDTERAFSLGLSATPERDNDEPSENETETGYDNSLLGQALGPIIYELTLANALELGIIPPYTIHHYGLPLTADERARYDQLSRAIKDSKHELRNHGAPSSDSDFYKWVRIKSTRGSGDVRALANRFLGDTSGRKKLLHSMSGRGDAVERLLRKEFRLNPDAQAILFHERIDEVMHLFVRLRSAGFYAIAEHSKLPASMREAGLEIFRNGIAKVLVSARSLIEGFNVPAVDIGIIVASSTSVRQRIQSLGRVLRRHRGPSGEEKTSCIHALYTRDTVDDSIYSKLDWNKITGAEHNAYYHWDLVSEPELQDGPPRTPPLPEAEVDVSNLALGDTYPGDYYEGDEMSCDTRGNVSDIQGKFASNLGHLPAMIREVKGCTGKFRITPRCFFVLVKVPEPDGWTAKFVTQLQEKPQFQDTLVKPNGRKQLDKWVETAAPGVLYPYFVPKAMDLRFKKKGGGVISKSVRRGEIYAIATDDASRLISSVQALHASGTSISKLEFNEENHVVYRAGGELFFVCALTKGLEFPTKPPE